MTSAEQHFLEKCSWLQCNDCLLSFSATTRFGVLHCLHWLICEHCYKKQAKSGERGVVECPRCKKNEPICIIRHSMDPKVRKYFEHPMDSNQPIDDLKKIQKFQETQENFNIGKMDWRNGQMRDQVNAMKGCVIKTNKQTEDIERESVRLEKALLREMTQEKFDHWMGKSLEELENYEKKWTNRATTPRPQNDGRAFDHRPPTDSGFHLDNSMASTPQRYRGSEATSTFYNDGGSRSSASSRANKRNTLLQTVQERNFRKHISPLLPGPRPEYNAGRAHQQLDAGDYQSQSTQIRTIRQKQAQEEAKRMEQYNRSAVTYNRTPSMNFKR